MSNTKRKKLLESWSNPSFGQIWKCFMSNTKRKKLLESWTNPSFGQIWKSKDRSGSIIKNWCTLAIVCIRLRCKISFSTLHLGHPMKKLFFFYFSSYFLFFVFLTFFFFFFLIYLFGLLRFKVENTTLHFGLTHIIVGAIVDLDPKSQTTIKVKP